jgi:hypothetical protein
VAGGFMGGEQRGQDVPATGGGSVVGGGSAASNDRPPDSEQVRTGRRKVPAWSRFRQWTPKQKIAVIAIVVPAVASVVAAIIAVVPPSSPSGGNGGSSSTGHSQVQNNTNNGGSGGGAGGSQIQNNGTNNGQVGDITNNNYGPTAISTGLSNNPQAKIVQLTGSYSEQGFTTAIFDRNASVVALYLKTGMNAATLYHGTSAILFGFEEVDQNGDPIQSGSAVALVKTFQAAGFNFNEDLQDSYLMGEITGGTFPGMFDTLLAPKGYTGGYQNGTFVGSLLFWIVQRALGWGPTAEDIQVIHYLVSQGADCKVTLSFLNYDGGNYSSGTGPYKKLFPIIQSCAK